MTSRGSARRGSLPPIRKSLGQHFLTDRRILSRIADAAEIVGGETVIEIGPGRGALTEILRERLDDGRLIAIEYDRALAALLRERFGADSKIEIVEADVLQVNLGQVAGGQYVVVGNVPYYITTPILFHALRPPRAERAVYLVQREVADRMTASPGDDAYGALSVNLQALASVETLFGIPAGAFSPPPKVDSAVVRVIGLRDPVLAREEEQGFRELVQSAFGMRRKQMRRVLRELQPMSSESADAVLREAGIEPEVRPETLSVGQFTKLYRRLSAFG
jgi:16S rRNA (adenine1518-N6/adenine1519-N6)-dimethyltransferase